MDIWNSSSVAPGNRRAEADAGTAAATRTRSRHSLAVHDKIFNLVSQSIIHEERRLLPPTPLLLRMLWNAVFVGQRHASSEDEELRAWVIVLN
jgi:hypothetical protein